MDKYLHGKGVVTEAEPGRHPAGHPEDASSGPLRVGLPNKGVQPLLDAVVDLSALAAWTAPRSWGPSQDRGGSDPERQRYRAFFGPGVQDHE